MVSSEGETDWWMGILGREDRERERKGGGERPIFPPGVLLGLFLPHFFFRHDDDLLESLNHPRREFYKLNTISRVSSDAF